MVPFSFLLSAAVLDDMGVQYWADFGTLLGMYREVSEQRSHDPINILAHLIRRSGKTHQKGSALSPAKATVSRRKARVCQQLCASPAVLQPVGQGNSRALKNKGCTAAVTRSGPDTHQQLQRRSCLAACSESPHCLCHAQHLNSQPLFT